MSSVLFDAQPFDFALQRRRRLLIAVAVVILIADVYKRQTVLPRRIA